MNRNDFFEKWEGKVKAEGFISNYELGLDSKMDSWGGWESCPTVKEFDNALGNENIQEFFNLSDDEMEEFFWDEELMEIMEQQRPGRYEQKFRDNTYNWGDLGPHGLVFSTWLDNETGEYFTLYHVHLGGDPRGNYQGVSLFVHDYYENAFLELVSNYNASITLEFDDGGKLQFYSTQSSDVWAFDLDEFESKDSPMTVDFMDDFSGSDDDLTEFLKD